MVTSQAPSKFIALFILLASSLPTAARQHRFELAITFDKRAGKSTPVRTVVDFDRLLGDQAGLIDPYSLMIVRRTGKVSQFYHVRFAEDLLYKNRGWTAWLVNDPQKTSRWFLEFKTRASDGRMVEPRYLPPVGVGDELAYNGAKYRPIDSPGYHAHPIPVDWNQDGLIDILSRSHGANRIGMPMAGIFFWRNIERFHSRSERRAPDRQITRVALLSMGPRTTKAELKKRR